MKVNRTVEVTEAQLNFIKKEWRGLVASRKSGGKYQIYLILLGGRTEKEIRNYLGSCPCDLSPNCDCNTAGLQTIEKETK